MRAFEPHLLVANDADGISPEVLAGIPCRVGVLYSSESMDANVYVDGRVEEVGYISTEDLLRVADEAVAGTRQT